MNEESSESSSEHEVLILDGYGKKKTRGGKDNVGKKKKQKMGRQPQLVASETDTVRLYQKKKVGSETSLQTKSTIRSCRYHNDNYRNIALDDDLVPNRPTLDTKKIELADTMKRHGIPVKFLNAFRPPSRHKTPPKALGLDLPVCPHTPPDTQQEIENERELSRTQQLHGISSLNKNDLHPEEDNNDSGPDSASKE